MRKMFTFLALAVCLAGSNVDAEQRNDNDYPTVALKNLWEGTVGFTVTVGTDGRAKNCVVTQSSGHDVLDQAACGVFVRRARFKPAEDGDGTPLESQYSSKIVYKIPQ